MIHRLFQNLSNTRRMRLLRQVHSDQQQQKEAKRKNVGVMIAFVGAIAAAIGSFYYFKEHQLEKANTRKELREKYYDLNLNSGFTMLNRYAQKDPAFDEWAKEKKKCRQLSEMFTDPELLKVEQIRVNSKKYFERIVELFEAGQISKTELREFPSRNVARDFLNTVMLIDRVNCEKTGLDGCMWPKDKPELFDKVKKMFDLERDGHNGVYYVKNDNKSQ